MIDTVIVFVTCGSREEAHRVAEILVHERLAACVNVIPSIESCYRWKGEVKWDAEQLLMVKTTEEIIDRVLDRIKAEHTYDLPEFVTVRIDAGSKAYLDWIAESVQPR